MTNRKRIAVVLSLCLGVAVAGTAGFMIVEHYTLPEALYMSIITLSTVGFSEVRPLSDTGRLFTAAFIVVGFVSLAVASHALVESLLTRVWSGRSEIRKMRKKIAHLKGHYIICGYGRVGAAAAERLAAERSTFMVIESSPEKVKLLQEKGILYIQNDATRESVLLEAGIKTARGLLALLDSDPENLFLALTAREMNPTLHIIARADESSAEKKIIRAGADTVVSLFAVTGKQIAENILEATGQVATGGECRLATGSGPVWCSIDTGSLLIGKNVTFAATEKGGQIIGLRREGTDHLYPDGEIRLRSGDRLLILEGAPSKGAGKNFSPPELRKVVIVDDNPVILSLYTRLFQKAGFLPLTAVDGKQGVERIIEHTPCVAVVDFELPVLSGIELCRQVRSRERCRKTRLVLFTGSSHSDTREKALSAGADAVVVKSADAGEIIKTVERVLAEAFLPDMRQAERNAVA
jgi:voltage-gated potassium channel